MHVCLAALTTYKMSTLASSADTSCPCVLHAPLRDDHEVINDFGPYNAKRAGRSEYVDNFDYLPMGMKVMLDVNPVAPAANTPQRMYRSFNWGKHADMFILDTRSYRDSNYESDSEFVPKTLLGREQVAWLKDGLARSTSTWKVRERAWCSAAD